MSYCLTALTGLDLMAHICARDNSSLFQLYITLYQKNVPPTTYICLERTFFWLQIHILQFKFKSNFDKVILFLKLNVS